MEREGEAAETETVTMEFLILAQLVTCIHILVTCLHKSHLGNSVLENFAIFILFSIPMVQTNIK